MGRVEERRLIYFQNEEHLVRRLGAAVVVVWKQLSHETRDLLIVHAERVLDQEESQDFEKQLSDLVAQLCRRTKASTTEDGHAFTELG